MFCKFAQHEIPVEVVYEDAKTFAFLDNHPRSLGHALVISKCHASNIVTLPQGEVAFLFEAVQRVTTALERAFVPSGFTIGINHGSISGQTIDHLHVHIIPRYTGDGGGSIHSVVDFPPKESLAEVLKRMQEIITS